MLIEENSYFLNDLGNCNETFRKDVAYDDNKSHNKGLTLNYFFGKATERGRGGQIDPRQSL